MAGKAYKTRCIVLRKTKLGEKDLIVTMLDESGALLRVVAKGARRPGGSYAARLELFSIVDVMCAEGKSLDVVTSAKLADGSGLSEFGIEQSACASVLAELLSVLAQEGLPHDRLFPMASAAFQGIAREDPVDGLKLTCSALLKALAYAGFRPSFVNCIACGEPIENAAWETVPFSTVEGGAVCLECPRPSDSVHIDAEVLRWCDALMRSRFEDVLAYEPDLGTLFSVLQLAQQWTRAHVGKNLKSLDFLFTAGLF
ncbi:MAG: DNA repair protein RecO [Eggerthellaceae bacterium]|nr:DNA repair protein RecO [Eggerthellaceae bacterium]